MCETWCHLTQLLFEEKFMYVEGSAFVDEGRVLDGHPRDWLWFDHVLLSGNEQMYEYK